MYRAALPLIAVPLAPQHWGLLIFGAIGHCFQFQRPRPVAGGAWTIFWWISGPGASARAWMNAWSIFISAQARPFTQMRQR